MIIIICDARRVGLGAQNRPEEGSQGVKRPVRRGLTEMRRDEKQTFFKTSRIDHRQRLLSASEAPWDLQGTRRSSENEPKRGSPVASSLASKIVPAPKREHDFHFGYFGFFDKNCLELSVALLAPFWVLLGALLASLRVLLVGIRGVGKANARALPGPHPQTGI